MDELSLSRIDDDGAYLVLSDADGVEYVLPITPELRSALRPRPKPRNDVATEPVTPKEIQSLLRAGATVEEVAELSGLSFEHIERFEGPVVAERAWVAQQSRELPVGRHPDTPSLGDLTIDRLATRRVKPEDLEWDAVRSTTGPWTLHLSFPLDGKNVEASWEVDLSNRSLHALDDEARWLSETDANAPRNRRRLSSVVSAFPARSEQVRDVEPEPPQSFASESLLDSLAESRGVRQPVPQLDEDPDLLEELAGFESFEHPEADIEPSDSENTTLELERGPASVTQLPQRPVPSLEPTTAADAPSESAAEPSEPDSSEPLQPKKRGTRRSVPSWDEIVFGSPSSD